jgi:asparagine synthase (glutamine-hydrolysing)
MFAFALWDEPRATLYMVRDRLGVKPLLYAQRNGAFAFASTARALEHAGFADEIDPQAVADYLEFGFVPDERSIFAGVHKLPAGHIAEWRNGELSIRQYWKPNMPVQTKMRFQDAVDEAERLLLRAVELRLEADVPVGALLSGGIDSSLVCWAIRRLGGDITAYTVATPGDVWDESSDAAATAAELGIRHRILAIDADSAPRIDDLTSAYGEPFACASALGMIAISQAVRKHATVLLTGDGGDDVFLGYPRQLHYFAAQRLARVLPPFSTAAWTAIRPVVPRNGVLRRGVHFVDYATGGLGAVAAVNDGLPYYAAHAMFGDRLRDASVAHRGYPRSVYAARRVLDEFV